MGTGSDTRMVGIGDAYMALDEVTVSREIMGAYHEKLSSALSVDVAVCGAGPSGLTAAALLARAGKKVVVFEKRMSTGGGIWGGGMMFNDVVVQETARRILVDFGIPHAPRGEGLYVVDAVALASGLTFGAVSAGAVILNLVQVEDLMMRGERVTGLVINWTAAGMTRLTVDPLVAASRVSVDATGHEAALVRILVSRGVKIDTPSGGMEGEKAMWAEDAEREVVENTREVYPGLYVTGMTGNTVHGGHRMGAVFGGMLLSGEKAAREILSRLD